MYLCQAISQIYKQIYECKIIFGWVFCHTNTKGYTCMVTFQIYWWRETSGAPPCNTSGTRLQVRLRAILQAQEGTRVQSLTFRKLAGKCIIYAVVKTIICLVKCNFDMSSSCETGFCM